MAMIGQCHTPQVTLVMTSILAHPSERSFHWRYPRHPNSSPNAGMALMSGAMVKAAATWMTPRSSAGIGIDWPVCSSASASCSARTGIEASKWSSKIQK